MSAIINTYLCGHLAVDTGLVATLNSDGWQEMWLHAYTDEQAEETKAKGQEVTDDYNVLTGIYYSTFINSMANHTDEAGNMVKLCSGYSGKKHLCKFVDATFSYKTSNNTIEVRVPHLHLFFMPDGVCIWALKAEYEAPKENVADTQQALRNFRSEFMPVYNEFLKYSLHHTIGDLVYSGNKAKIFQHIQSDDITDERLFEYGSLLKYRSTNSDQAKDRPDKLYFEKTIKENRVAAFSNWSALALVDTFTILGDDTCQWDIRIDGYFRFIYLNCLYQKIILFDINRAFRSSDNNIYLRKQLHKTVNNKHWYSFTQISYNFLPQMIFDAIDKGMELSKERENLAKLVEEASEQSEKRAERLTNSLLTTLAIVSALSVLFDFSEFLNKYFSFTEFLSRWLSISLLGAILLVFIFRRIFQRNE